MKRVGRVRAHARRRRLHLGRRLRTSATGSPSRTTRSRLSGRDDEQGSDRHRVLRAFDRSARAAPRACSARPTTRRATTALLAKIKAAFSREYVTRDGPRRRSHADGLRRSRSSSTCCRKSCARRRPRGSPRTSATRKHLTTGFLGTPYLCHVLSRYGYLDEAYLLLNREEYPSWLYPVKQGATTIWERWDGQKPDGIVPGRGR